MELLELFLIVLRGTSISTERVEALNAGAEAERLFVENAIRVPTLRRDDLDNTIRFSIAALWVCNPRDVLHRVGKLVRRRVESGRLFEFEQTWANPWRWVARRAIAGGDGRLCRSGRRAIGCKGGVESKRWEGLVLEELSGRVLSRIAREGDETILAGSRYDWRIDGNRIFACESRHGISFALAAESLGGGTFSELRIAVLSVIVAVAPRARSKVAG